MHIGVVTVVFQDLPFEEMLDHVVEIGLSAVEIGTGGYPGSHHCPVDELLESESKRQEYLEAVTSRGLIISGFSCHNNPVHPNREIAREADRVLLKTVRLASLMDVPVINCFSGLPAGAPGDKMPNWATCPWPPPLFRDPGLSMERGGDPLLERDGQVRARSRRQVRVRDAPRHVGLQRAHAAEAARRGGAGDWVQL